MTTLSAQKVVGQINAQSYTQRTGFKGAQTIAVMCAKFEQNRDESPIEVTVE